ncbi:hypothetical protein SABR111722_02475 [Saccharibacillus brassicae]
MREQSPGLPLAGSGILRPGQDRKTEQYDYEE